MAGEQIATAVVKVLLSKLGSTTWSELGLLWDFQNDLEGMKTTLELIQAVLNDAEKQSFNGASVRLWLKKLKAAAYDIEDMLDQFQTQNQSNDLNFDCNMNNFFSIFMSIFSLLTMAHRLKVMRKTLDNIAAERSKYNLREETISNQQEDRTTSSVVNKNDVIGRGEEATGIINRLLSPSDAISIIPIVGIGGLGKTTLAKLIFNDDRMKVFEQRIWVHAMDFRVERLVEEILLSLGAGNRNDLGNLESKIKRAKESLDGKRYLVVLDDVWNEKDKKWEDFKQVLQDGKGGSKILVTARSERVPRIMKSEIPHMLKPLSDDVCLKLFEQKAFLSPGAKDQKLASIGKEIVKKCRGVPLIAKILGGMLHFTSGEATWEEVRDSELWELRELEEGGSQPENEIMSPLKLSYPLLPPSSKLCFLYCSLYPRAFRLGKDMLIQHWTAQRLIQMGHDGDSHIKHLLANSFLEETGVDTYKMHDLLYDLARYIAGDEVSVLEAGKTPKINPEECRYASIIGYHQPSELRSDLLKKVRALHFQECSSLPQEIFSHTKFLRVLDLNYNSDCNLPTSIYELKLLRYLKFWGSYVEIDERIGELLTLEMLIISYSNRIRTLPVSIGKLRNLTHLDLSFSRELSKLPDSIWSLKNLSSLNFCGCSNLETLPESLKELTSLRTLDIRKCPIANELPASINDMKDLEVQIGEPLELGPDRHVIELYLIDGPHEGYVVWNIHDAVATNLKNRGGSIKSLHCMCTYAKGRVTEVHRRGWVVEAMLEALQPHQNLQELRIWEYQGSKFPTWMRRQMESFLPNLVKIELEHIPNCEYLPVLGQLPKLEEIFIREMLQVRRISEEFCGVRNTTGTSFPSLKRLDLMEMLELEEWVTAVAGDGERGASLFPCLEELNIQNCPKLQIRPCIPPSVTALNLSWRTMPLLMMRDVHEISLKHLCLNEHEFLTSLPDSIRHLTSLETLRIRYCKFLRTLPEWLGDLSSLRCLEICDCPLIKRLPKSIQRLTALETLDITACSEKLWKRTEKEIGKDWNKISHIQNVNIIEGYPWD
ncbi:putative disease resistance protein RGA1 isoform X1 [Typha latifolia]|uniref:putative disease resistance protein RGA1 isoform X1 n=1 Tax=Typha latifolia TaxID=4733 RepID=UPI003C2DE037